MDRHGCSGEGRRRREHEHDRDDRVLAELAQDLRGERRLARAVRVLGRPRRTRRVATAAVVVSALLVGAVPVLFLVTHSALFLVPLVCVLAPAVGVLVWSAPDL